MTFEDKWLVCADCGREFLWDAGEQAWYYAKGLRHPPRRCKFCRERRRNAHPYQPYQHTQMSCYRCGSPVAVPFVPHGTRPVYCRMCYDHLKSESVALRSREG